ncbi:MAG: hypothetical protein M3Z09_08785 [Acidobacteriota bacterium]|nr:hypothetical protein [Acidobacteriota bacterium]
MNVGFCRKHFTKLVVSCFVVLSGAAQAQTLVIVGGQGQLVASSSVATLPLTVQLLDASGRPFPGQTVSFTDNAGGQFGSVNGSAPPTDANGITSVQFVGANLNLLGSAPFVQTNINAVYSNFVATFYETTSNQASNGGLLTQVNIQYPQQGQLISGPAGSPGTQPILVRVGTLSSAIGIPNVSVSINVDSSAGSTGTISCREGPFVLTDSTGLATCTPVFGKIGSGTFTILVGGLLSFSQNAFTVTVGAPGIISVTSGGNQAGLPGQQLPVPLLAVVTDLAGNIIVGAQVVFESVTPNGATFINSRTSSDANGRVSTSVILGNVPGPIQIRIRDVGNLVANPPIVTETVNITISGLFKISGDNQTAFVGSPVGAPFAQPLTVRVSNATSQPVQGASVQFAVTTGSAALSNTTAITGPDGLASTSVTAGSLVGPVTVTATSGGFSQTFTLTVIQIGPSNFSYLNGASFVPNSLSPGSIVTINAQGLVGSNIQGTVGGSFVGPMPFNVAGVSVTLNNIPAPIYYVSNQNGQQSVTIQVPFEVPPGVVPITVSASVGGSTNGFVTVLPVSPGLFESVNTDGRRRVVALRPNGTVVTPANPAVRGENLRVYATGLGPVSPNVPTGSFSPAGSDPAITSNLVAGINNNGVPIVQAIYARNLVGVYELTVMVPNDAVAFPSGTVNFSVAVQGPNGYVYSNGSLIAVQ